MSHNYGLRPLAHGLDSDGFNDEDEAASTVDATSSPCDPYLGVYDIRDDVLFLSLGAEDLPEDDAGDLSYNPGRGPAQRFSDDEKTIEVL